ncbi:MAG: chemotaxis protein CheW [Dehalococcoidia bacterium]
MAGADTTERQAERQLVVFEMGAEAYAVQIGVVREIIRMQEITRVPGATSSMEGVINLRGKLIPVVDLRKRLRVAAGDAGMESRIMIVDIEGEDVGAIVDAVTEVVRVAAEAIEPPSELVATADASFVEGIARLGERLVVLLDVRRILAAEAGPALAAAGSGA